MWVAVKCLVEWWRIWNEKYHDFCLKSRLDLLNLTPCRSDAWPRLSIFPAPPIRCQAKHTSHSWAKRYIGFELALHICNLEPVYAPIDLCNLVVQNFCRFLVKVCVFRSRLRWYAMGYVEKFCVRKKGGVMVCNWLQMFRSLFCAKRLKRSRRWILATLN